MQYDAFFKIWEWKFYFHYSVVHHTGYPAAKGVQFYLVLLAVIKKD